MVFQRQCAGCHQGSRQYPDLTPQGVLRLTSLESRDAPGEALIVPGDPDASWLYRMMSGAGGQDDALMPLGADEPIVEIATIEAWIAEGAPSECDELPPVDPIPYDPNALDRDALFTCEDPTAPRTSPARIRRIDAREFNALAIGKAGTNPLAAPEGTRYSTYAEDISVDTPTLQLLMSQFPRAVIEWTVRDPQQSGARRMFGPAPGAGCVSTENAPSDECIDGYVTRLLTRGAYGRSPSADEHARLRALLVDAIAREASEGIPRQETLELVAQAARLSSGALFRPELGESDDDRRRLTDAELGLALSAVLSTSPAGLPIPNDPSGTVSDDDPDVDNLGGGRLYRITDAVADGSIGDPAVRVALFRQYAGGTADRRPDLSTRASTHDPRGEFWLSGNLIRFFQEWLDYGSANTRFKQDPDLTSGFESDDTGPSFGNLRSSANGNEATLVQHLDDLIARVVIETDQGDGDVFEELMTTTTWHLPSNLGAGSSVPCSSAMDCEGTSQQYCTHTGFCTGSTRRSHYWMQAVFGVRENVGTAREDRWVEMDASRRMGVLTHPAWLAAHGGNFEDDASLVLRGNWIRRRVFCQSFGDLSDVRGLVAMLPAQPEDGPMLSARQRVVHATEDPATEDAASCFGCHQFMNSLGYPFELYNHAGFERAYDHGGAVDGSTVIDNLPDPALNRAYASPMELVQAIATSREARRGFVRHAFRFFMGRDEVLEDRCTLMEMEAALNESGSFFAMIEALISSETFEYRHRGGM